MANFSPKFVADDFAEKLIEIPTEFNVFQNYPNPFNPSTSIKYGLPEVSTVKINVFDIMGRQVVQDDLGTVSAGYHVYTVHAAGGKGNLSSGIYLYKVDITSESGKKMSYTKKMTLMK